LYTSKRTYFLWWMNKCLSNHYVFLSFFWPQ
jgi:hypothetical protein